MSSATGVSTPSYAFSDDEGGESDSDSSHSIFIGLPTQPSRVPKLPSIETDELAKFREEWRSEVSRRNRLPTSNQPATAAPETSTPVFEGPRLAGPSRPKPLHGSSTANSASASHATSQGVRPTTIKWSSSEASALRLYREAILNEEAGEMDEATRLYQAGAINASDCLQYFYSVKHSNSIRTSLSSMTVKR